MTLCHTLEQRRQFERTLLKRCNSLGTLEMVSPQTRRLRWRGTCSCECHESIESAWNQTESRLGCETGFRTVTLTIRHAGVERARRRTTKHSSEGHAWRAWLACEGIQAR